MRVKSLPYLPSIIALGEVVSLSAIIDGNEDGDASSFDQFLAAPEPPEDRNAIVSEELMRLIKPGWDRTIIVLRTEGYTLRSVQQITGLSETAIRRRVQRVRETVTSYCRDRS